MTNEQLQQILQDNQNLRIEILAAISRLFREHGETFPAEDLVGISLCLNGCGGDSGPDPDPEPQQ